MGSEDTPSWGLRRAKIQWGGVAMDQPPDASGCWGKHVRVDGRALWLKTSKNSTGYENVIKQGRCVPYSVKFRPDPTKKAQRHLPGSSSLTAREAAIKYAEYLESCVELVPTRHQMARGEVRDRLACSA